MQRADALPVSGFGLLHAREDVFRVMQVVVVEGVVLEGGAREPACLCGFDEQAAARGDVLVTAAFEGVVGGPAPHVFYVGGGGGGQVHHCKRGFAIRCVGAVAGGVDVCVRCAADCDVGIPHAHVTLFGARHVHLQDNSARRDIGHCKAHVLDLSNTDIAGIADLYNGHWVVGIAEKATDTRDHGPGFSDNASSRRDKDSGLDNVNAVRKVGDLAVGRIGS